MSGGQRARLCGKDGLADGAAASDKERHNAHDLPDGRGRGGWAEDGLTVGVVDGRRYT